MNEQEFAQIVHRTKATVLAAIARHLPPEYRHAIDDIAQETYLRAYRSLVKNRYAEKGHMSAWLYQIAKNETLRMIKRLGWHERIDETAMATDDSHAGNEKTGEFITLVRRLPEKYSRVVELVLSGHSEQEISEMLNIPIGTVKSRKSRGKDMLYKILKKEEYHYYGQ